MNIITIQPSLMNRFDGSCNTIKDPYGRICVPNKIDVNLKVFNMIKGIIESKSLTKHISCDCGCEFDSRKCNSRQKWNKINVTDCGYIGDCTNQS